MLSRKGTQDSAMIRDVIHTDYPYANCAGHVVLDLGAHIGAFTNKALEEGAKRVVAVEPWSPNRELLLKNFGDDARVTIISKACSIQESLTLTIPNEASTGAVSGFVNHRSPSRTEVVTTISLEKLVKQYDPTFIKIDIEGAEYEVLPCDLTGVQHICGELHTMSNQARQSALKLLAWLETQGFYLSYMKAGPIREKMFERLLYIHFHAYRKNQKAQAGPSKNSAAVTSHSTT